MFLKLKYEILPRISQCKIPFPYCQDSWQINFSQLECYLLWLSSEFWKNKVWKNVSLCFIQAGIICHMYCYYLFSWTEQQFVFIWSFWLLTLLFQESFCLPASSCFVLCEWPVSICGRHGLPCFCFDSYRFKKARWNKAKEKHLLFLTGRKAGLESFFNFQEYC